MKSFLKDLKDINCSYKSHNTMVLLFTEVYNNGPLYILLVDNGQESTKDSFKSFDEAFDSFTNIIKTITKGDELCNS